VAAAALAVATAVSVLRAVPHIAPDPDAGLRRELGALRRPQVWLAVGTGAIGGGGMFAIYSYISPILTHRAGMPVSAVPIALAIWGLGMVTANLVGGRVLDWRPVPAMFGAFVLISAVFALFTVASTHVATALPVVFLLGASLVLPLGLQTRLMDVSADAQTLGAALNHSAFNIANALGAWLGGIVLGAGLGYAAPIWVAVGLTLIGMAIFAFALTLERRRSARCSGALATSVG